MSATVVRRLFLGGLRAQPARLVLPLAAIALGVALGVAVATIHRSALDEFADGLRQLAGQADTQVVGPREGFDEALYPLLARHPAVGWASPVVEVQAALAAPAADAPRSLRLIGVDPLRAWRVNPALLPGPQQPADDDRLGLLADNTIALTPAAATALGVSIGDTLRFLAGSEVVTLRVIALLPGVGDSRRLAVADIATVQHRFHRLGLLSRIDLLLTGPAEEIAALLPPGVHLEAVAEADARGERLSRAYRVNLALLALIALVTGAFLVFSAQAASVVRRRAEFAFLRAAGLTRGELMRGLLAEGAVLGALGSALGVATGIVLAALALGALGGDLGAGFFAGGATTLRVSAAELLLQFALGTGAAIVGAWLPAREAARTPPARALKAGDAATALAGLDRLGPGLAALIAGGVALLLPPVGGLPLGAYAAIGLWLAGSVLLLPRLARAIFARLPAGRSPIARLAVAQLRSSPALASVGIAGIVAATAVAAAMAIMVGSFRDSVDRWLGAVLPAEIYLRAGRSGETGFLDEAAQAAIAAVPGVARVDFIRHVEVRLAGERPPVTLIARPLSGAPAALVGLPAADLAGAGEGGNDGPPLLWASEAMADLYGWRPGQSVELPLAGRTSRFIVGGLWRDYVRSHGAVLLDLASYRALTGDRLAHDAAIFRDPAVPRDELLARLRALPGGGSLEISSQESIRALSLAIFDRTFAVTYALEAAAVLIGLAGVAASFAALATARLREFGMLAHLGLTRRELQSLVAAEGAIGAALGIVVGLVLASAIARVLIDKVNRESFHWSMDFALPALPLAAFALAMLAGATLAAVLAARPACGRRAVAAVREDW